MLVRATVNLFCEQEFIHNMELRILNVSIISKITVIKPIGKWRETTYHVNNIQELFSN